MSSSTTNGSVHDEESTGMKRMEIHTSSDAVVSSSKLFSVLSTAQRWSTKQRKAVAVAVVLCLALILLTVARSSYNTKEDSSSSVVRKEELSSSSDLLNFSCPEPRYFSRNETLLRNPRSKWYLTEKSAEKMTPDRVAEFLESFRKSSYDGWGDSYESVKEKRKPVIQHWFTRHLNQPGRRTVYESACGVGLSLYALAETLNEMNDTKFSELIVYGNEYIPESAAHANLLYDVAPPDSTTKGVICAGDSTHIHWVPSNSFDLVFTGYMSPINDPLQLYLDPEFKPGLENALYKSWCKKSEKNLVFRVASRVAQETQEEFFAEWIGEMIRLAKPGAGIIIQDIAFPVCIQSTDWGGVNQTFFGSESVKKYGWDVDVDYIEFSEQVVVKDRYNVYMVKNNRGNDKS